MKSTRDKAFFGIGLACSVVAALVPAVVTPRFNDVFVGFGAELPLITRVFVRHHFVFWLLPALVVAAGFFWPKPHLRALAACVIGIFGFLVIPIATVIAMYLPIFKLAATI